jgi:hypothetical protein
MADYCAVSTKQTDDPKSLLLADGNYSDKVALLWLNTELRGCRATALETM